MPTGFEEKVYAACAKIPKGKISTYSEIARHIRCRSSQAVGNALRKNPYAPRVPCHRVVRCDGSVGGFNGCTEGKPVRNKISLLKKEGVSVREGFVDNFPRMLFRF